MKQLSFPPRGRGGYRPGSGRKGGNRVTHHGRQGFVVPIPLHVVWRTRPDVRSLRGKNLWRQIRESFRRCCEKLGFRLVHFSVQGTHVHLIVEADTTDLLSRGLQGLGVSMAKRINFTLQRRGPAFDDRYFARRLRTPREVANAVDYVIHNQERHLRRRGLEPAEGLDPFCSAALADAVPRLVAPPETWLLRIGYLRARKAA
jgi:REP element-mobilizing transposase RayT